MLCLAILPERGRKPMQFGPHPLTSGCGSAHLNQASGISSASGCEGDKQGRERVRDTARVHLNELSPRLLFRHLRTLANPRRPSHRGALH